MFTLGFIYIYQIRVMWETKLSSQCKNSSAKILFSTIHSYQMDETQKQYLANGLPCLEYFTLI